MHIHILTAHFGDIDWTHHLMKKIQIEKKLSKHQISITVINQDRTLSSLREIKSWGSIDVVEVEKNDVFISATGHDHSWALDSVWSKIDCDILILFDCDAHPIKNYWIEWVVEMLKTHGAVLAEDHLRKGKSHPCFMAMTREVSSSRINFSDGVLEEKEDTGRRILEQLQSRDVKTLLLPPRRRFCKIAGITYDQWIYHHGSGTFHASKDTRLLNQVHRYEAKVKNIILNENRYDFSLLEKAAYKIGKFFNDT